MKGKATTSKKKPPARVAAPRKASRAPASAPAHPDHGMCVAAIGASAGGFDAICELLEVLPADMGLAYVVVQHLSPTQKSLAAELFAKRTAMSVVEATEGVRLRPNTLYTLPGDADATLDDGVLHLAAPREPRGRRLPIDTFLRSLSVDQQQRAIAIILSGTGTDGSLGLRHVVAEGGIVMVQEPESAQFDGMPRSAIATGLATHVLPIAQMPNALAEWARHPYASAALAHDQGAGEIETGSLRAILELIRRRHGYNFHGYKQRMLERRIRRRMGLRRIRRMTEYVAVLRKHPHEVDALFRDLLIGVTEFFRDRDAWQVLEQDVVDAIVRAKADGAPIRVWVSGASTGEEAYSLAMLLLDKLKERKKHCPLQVFATDTNDNAIAVARNGVYSAGIVAQVPPDRLRRYFTEARNDHHYEVTRELRESVIFGVHNLFSDPPFSRLDLIICRNLLIYLEPESQRRVILLFHSSLRPGGALFLGPAETVGQRDDLFRLASRKWRIFRRTGTTPREDVDWQAPGEHRTPLLPPMAGRRVAGEVVPPAAIAQQILLDRFTPAAVLINRKFEVQYFCGPTERFLAQPRGSPTKDLLALAREGLRTHLRNAVRRADTSGEAVTLHDARMRRRGGFDTARITVTPSSGDPEVRSLLVVFEDEPPPTPPAKPRRRAVPDLLHQLEGELRAAKDDLQTTIERLETSNEELRVSHEEVVSANEELQSVNEEMESSKEELQSLNEELNTVNQQLQSKVGELESTNNDLRNLLASSDIATICLDRELRIKWFTPSTRDVLKVILTDVGRPISDLGSPLAGESLMRDARAVLATLTPVQTEVRSERDRWYSRRTLPYRTEDDRIDGVIATFTDVTEARLVSESRLQAKDAVTDALEQRVEERTRQLRGLASELALAEERERRAVARDLHDDLGQVLNLARFKLDRLVRNSDTGAMREGLADIDRLINHAHQSVRSLTFQLSPPVLEELGLVPALQWLADEMQHAYGLHVETSVEGAPLKALPEATRSILFRAVRELLLNVARHARVDAAAVRLHTGNGQVEVTVTDAGVGFDAGTLTATAQPGLGLLNLRERLSYIGGAAEIRSEPGQGTVARLVAPIEGTDNQRGGTS